MAEKIRRIEENDFISISEMYNGRKSVEELQWLFTNPEDKTIYNAYVAENNKGQIIGVIGYVSSTYIQDDKVVNGIIPMSWKISPDYKGMAGVLLFKKVIGLNDFTFAISGTTNALDLYTLFKLKKTLKINQFYKIINIVDVLKSYKRKSFVKTVGVIGHLLPSYIHTPKKKKLYQDLEFIKYNESNYSGELIFSQAFKKEITSNYIDWLLSCPNLKSFAFTIKRGDILYGVCILCTKIINNSKRGRIVYLPFLGNDKILWKSVISKCIDFFKKEKCCLITAQSFHPITTSGYSDSGFVRISKHQHPLFIKDSNNKLKSINLENWHIQYSEGDKFYRDL